MSSPPILAATLRRRQGLLEIDGLASAYGRVVALKGVSLHVAMGETVALVGANGAGKTTLLRCLSGVQPASGGHVRFEGRDITSLAPHHRVALGMGHVPEGRQVFGPLAVEDNLRLGAFRRGRAEMTDGLARIYAMFPALAERRDIAAEALSGGQQQMLAIGRALMSRPRLLLLDEPSMGLAPMLVDQILAAVARLKLEGVTMLLVEQNAAAALSIADRGYVIETGTIAHVGSGADLLHDPAVREGYLGV
jgi:branched-chain amino acid transport system ATP-binding protein